MHDQVVDAPPERRPVEREDAPRRVAAALELLELARVVLLQVSHVCMYCPARVLEARRGDLVVSGEGLATGQAADRLAVARRASSAGGL